MFIQGTRKSVDICRWRKRETAALRHLLQFMAVPSSVWLSYAIFRIYFVVFNLLERKRINMRCIHLCFSEIILCKSIDIRN